MARRIDVQKPPRHRPHKSLWRCIGRIAAAANPRAPRHGGGDPPALLYEELGCAASHLTFKFQYQAHFTRNGAENELFGVHRKQPKMRQDQQRRKFSLGAGSVRKRCKGEMEAGSGNFTPCYNRMARIWQRITAPDYSICSLNGLLGSLTVNIAPCNCHISDVQGRAIYRRP